tara:strand:- start:78 stop:266 length:189 start_codon:yes stop_codon:yes gene_type:complete
MIVVEHGTGKRFSKSELYKLLQSLVNSHYKRVSNYHKEAVDSNIEKYLVKVHDLLNQISKQK